MKIEKKYVLFWTGSAVVLLVAHLFIEVSSINGAGLVLLDALFENIREQIRGDFRPITLISLIAFLISTAFLTWPLLLPRSEKIAALASAMVWLPVITCFVIPNTKCWLYFGSDGFGLYITYPAYWAFIILTYVLRKRIRSETFVSGAILAVKSLAICALIFLIGMVLGLFLVVALGFISPFLFLFSLGWTIGIYYTKKIRPSTIESIIIGILVIGFIIVLSKYDYSSLPTPLEIVRVLWENFQFMIQAK